MRILLVTNYQPPHMGGIEFAAEALKHCWESLGHEVTWLSTNLPPGARPPAQDNIRINCANFLERWFQINSPIPSPCSYPEIVRLVRAHDVINIHSLAPGLSTLAFYAAIRHNRPVVATQHVGIIPLRFKFTSILQEKFLCGTARWCQRHDTTLTFVGEAVRDWFAEHAGLSKDTLPMTPAGINQDDYFFVPDNEREPLRAKWEVEPNRFNALFVGRFYEKKGLSLIRDLAGANPKVNFTLLGSGPIDPSTWNLSNVRVISSFLSAAELRELYGTHDLFVMPSIGEGWPAVVPQAMACGLPCLISNETFQGYHRDSDMFLLSARNVDKLSDILQSAAQRDIPLVKERRRVSEYAAAHWDWMATAKIYLELFQSSRSEKCAP